MIDGIDGAAGVAFQSLLQEHCAQADVAYVPPVVVSTRSRFAETRLSTADDRKSTKTGKKDDRAKPVDDRTGTTS